MLQLSGPLSVLCRQKSKSLSGQHGHGQYVMEGSRPEEAMEGILSLNTQLTQMHAGRQQQQLPPWVRTLVFYSRLDIGLEVFS